MHPRSHTHTHTVASPESLSLPSPPSSRHSRPRRLTTRSREDNANLVPAPAQLLSSLTAAQGSGEHKARRQRKMRDSERMAQRPRSDVGLLFYSVFWIVYVVVPTHTHTHPQAYYLEPRVARNLIFAYELHIILPFQDVKTECIYHSTITGRRDAQGLLYCTFGAHKHTNQ